ncbi:MAG: hypothetical protein Q8O25_09765 [Sulfurisoma sp.]|nr:hypothetical protein [Sulfurisoma sp.]
MIPTVAFVRLRADAPPKPLVGVPCNGCGVCCAVEPCPVARFALGVRAGACPALEWDGATARYYCGMAQRPADYLGWLSPRLNTWAARCCQRWIAAGHGCDCDAEVVVD